MWQWIPDSFLKHFFNKNWASCWLESHLHYEHSTTLSPLLSKLIYTWFQPWRKGYITMCTTKAWNNEILLFDSSRSLALYFFLFKFLSCFSSSLSRLVYSHTPSVCHLQRQTVPFPWWQIIWLLNNFSFHCDLARGWDVKGRGREKEKGKAKNWKGQKDTLLREKGNIRPQSFRKCQLIWTGTVRGTREDQTKV